jgi:hypothetical protein
LDDEPRQGDRVRLHRHRNVQIDLRLHHGEKLSTPL